MLFRQKGERPREPPLFLLTGSQLLLSIGIAFGKLGLCWKDSLQFIIGNAKG